MPNYYPFMSLEGFENLIVPASFNYFMKTEWPQVSTLEANIGILSSGRRQPELRLPKTYLLWPSPWDLDASKDVH